jgi:hypothetical protein
MASDPYLLQKLSNLNNVNVPTLKYLLNTNPNINFNRIINNYDTLLHRAVETQNINKVRLLLKYGANPNVRGAGNDTPLHTAACRGPVRIVELLLKAGANPNVRDVNDQTPMHVIFECDQGARTKRSMDVLKLLLKYGANPFLKNEQGLTFYNYVRLPILNAPPAMINLVRKKMNENRKKAALETMPNLPQNLQSRIFGMANVSKNTVLEKEKAAPKLVGAIKALGAGRRARREYGPQLQQRMNVARSQKRLRNQQVNMLGVKSTNTFLSFKNLYRKLSEARARATTQKEREEYFNIIYNKYIKNAYPPMKNKNINVSKNKNYGVTKQLLGNNTAANISENRKNLRNIYTKPAPSKQKLKELVKSKTFKKKLTNKEILQMLSNQSTRITNINALMNRLPMYKHTGITPRAFENIGVNNNQGIWTKPQWVTYLALSLTKRYQNSWNLSSSINWAINKGLRSTSNKTTKNKIRQRVSNLKEQNFVTLMDLYNLLNMFPVRALANIGY